MIFYPTLILGALGGAPSAVPAPPPVPFVLADETFESVSEEFDAAYRAWRRKPRNDRGVSPAKEFLPRFQALAEGGSVPAMVWVCDQLGGLRGEVEDASGLWQAWMNQIVEAHSDEAAAVAALPGLYRSGLADLETRESMARMWLENGVHASGRTLLMYSLGQILLQQGSDESVAEAIALYTELEEDFPEDDWAKRAGGEVFKRTRLQVGLEVPDFEAEDVDGVSFRLSDYRGKVVLLDFWGFW